MIGIYSITNKITGARYIGESVNIEARWMYHKKHLRNNDHDNCFLQDAWNTDGESAFKFEVLEWFPYSTGAYRLHKNIIITLLILREYYYMNKFKSLYNIENTLKSALKSYKIIDGFDIDYAKAHIDYAKFDLPFSDFDKIAPYKKEPRERKPRRRKYNPGEYAAKIDDDEEIIDYSF